MRNVFPPSEQLPASRITQAEVQAFLDSANAQMMNAGMTRVEVLGQMKDPSAESITYRWQQRHGMPGALRHRAPEMGWVTVGRGEQGEMVLLESTSDLDGE